jgi:hypothetical protein
MPQGTSGKLTSSTDAEAPDGDREAHSDFESSGSYDDAVEEILEVKGRMQRLLEVASISVETVSCASRCLRCQLIPLYDCANSC